MKVIGLTGGVGSGKSLVAQMLAEECHAGLLITDELGHVVMEKGTEAFREIVKYFGDGILGADGRIDRAVLAERVFGDEPARQKLNAVIHPAVLRYVEEYIACRGQKAGTIVLESALLFESGCDRFCDCIWYVHVAEGLRRQRLRENRGYSEEKTAAIMERQLSEAEFLRRSDVVLENNGSVEELRHQVRQKLDGYGVIGNKAAEGQG